jgi:TPR repeat protein
VQEDHILRGFLKFPAPPHKAPFTFDSSRCLNCHSNFPFNDRPARAQQGAPGDRDLDRGMLRNWGCGERASNNGEPTMASIDFAAVTPFETIAAILPHEPEDAEGCFECGMIHSAGAGVPVDLIEAHKWFNIAAMRGHRDAAQLRREIAELMSDSEICQAQRAARDWLNRHPAAPAPIALRVAA